MRIALAFVTAALLFGCQTMRGSEGARGEIATATQAWIDVRRDTVSFIGIATDVG